MRDGTYSEQESTNGDGGVSEAHPNLGAYFVGTGILWARELWREAQNNGRMRPWWQPLPLQLWIVMENVLHLTTISSVVYFQQKRK